MLKNLDLTTKIILIILIALISYFIFFTLFQSFFIKTPTTMWEMMQQMMGVSQTTTIVNALSLSLALVVALLSSIYLKVKPNKIKELDECKILKKALSEDESKMLNEVRRAGKITQDSLRFRLGWSKAKVSRILTNLDKMSLIQREKVGKTYNVFLQKK